MAKIGGGINGMHLTNTDHPFGVQRKTPMPKRASSGATGATAASRPGMRSANAVMKSGKIRQA